TGSFLLPVVLFCSPYGALPRRPETAAVRCTSTYSSFFDQRGIPSSSLRHGCPSHDVIVTWASASRTSACTWDCDTRCMFFHAAYVLPPRSTAAASASDSIAFHVSTRIRSDAETCSL